jgi:putative glycosyltransferase (TIGR04348 family)
MTSHSKPPRRKPVLALVTPALADANNGNWQTARRWARMLAADCRVRLVSQWRPGDNGDLLLALHARRSAGSIAAYAQAHPQRALVVALTGTALSGDIPNGDAAALRSLDLATRLIVLQDMAPDAVPAAHRGKAQVCFQSTPGRRQLDDKTTQRLRAVVVGHLRAVKDPLTVLRAVARLAHRDDIVVDHLGGALEPELGRAARACMRAHPGIYRWLGPVDHARALARIQRAHVLVHPSVMEGGAHVVMEAVRCGTPVIASRMAGNLGMLGRDYRGVFDVGDDAGLAAMLERARDDARWLAGLERQCGARAKLFAPEREQATLRRVMAQALADVRCRT